MLPPGSTQNSVLRLLTSSLSHSSHSIVMIQPNVCGTVYPLSRTYTPGTHSHVSDVLVFTENCAVVLGSAEAAILPPTPPSSPTEDQRQNSSHRSDACLLYGELNSSVATDLSLSHIRDKSPRMPRASGEPNFRDGYRGGVLHIPPPLPPSSSAHGSSCVS